MFKILVGFIILICLWGFNASECDSDLDDSWDEWENCTVIRYRERICTAENDCEPDDYNDTIRDEISNFTTCPLSENFNT
jgi:hypothetical protein